MNRLTYLRQTLPANIEQNLHHPNVEFVLLDYNSQDDLEDWVKTTLKDHIESGILKYYRTYEPPYFHLSHSKNMALKLASGNIICLVDADNFAGPSYIDWVDSCFDGQGSNAIITTLEKTRIPLRDQGGKLAFSRELLHSVKGFDESLVGYGIDDVDLVNRLEKAGGERVFIREERFLQFLGHSTEERLKNHYLLRNLEGIYAYFLGPRTARIVYLLTENRFLEVIYEFDEDQEQNQIVSYVGWSIADGGVREGSTIEEDGYLKLVSPGHEPLMIPRGDIGKLPRTYTGELEAWKEVPPYSDTYFEIVMGYGECLNRRTYWENDRNKRTVNPGGWGKGTVFLNFDRNKAIHLS